MKPLGILGIVILILIILGALFVRTYTSSPGFVTQKAAQEFEANAPKCQGFSFLLNAAAMAADAPGKSLCIGILAKPEQEPRPWL